MKSITLIPIMILFLLAAHLLPISIYALDTFTPPAYFEQKASAETLGYEPLEAFVNSGYPNYHETLLLYLVNEVRCDPAAAGWPAYPSVKPLIYNYELNYVARAHCIDMHDNNCFQHDSCNGTPWNTRIRAYYDGLWIGENIAAGASSVEQAMDVWLNSQGHRENIVRAQFRELGPGVYFGTLNYKNYYNQDFGYMADFPIPLVPSAIATPQSSGSTATYTFKAIYYANRYNPSAGAPSKAWVIIDGACNTMTLSSTVGTAAYGVYEYQTSLGPASHWYFFYFEAPDGRSCRYPPTGTFQINSADFWSPTSADVPCLSSTAYSGYFNSGADSWAFTAPGGPFAAPSSLASNGMLMLGSPNNTNTFGYWQSSSSALIVESNTLYKARFRVSSDLDAENFEEVPEFRLRANSANLQQADYLTVDSHGDALYSPRNYGLDYDHYFVPPSSAVGDYVTFAFDLLNFNPSDAANATLSFDSVVVYKVPISSLGTPQNVTSYDFSASEQGWVFGGAPTIFTLPNSAYDSGALWMTARNNTNTFGYWYSPYAAISLQRDRLYRASFVVKNNESNFSIAPTLRLRLNTENLQASLAKEIVSAGNGANSPSTAGTTYVLYMFPPQTAVGATYDGLSLSFDMLNFDPSDSSSTTFMLDQVSVDTLPVPTIP